MIAVIVAKDLESMEQWGGMHSNIQSVPLFPRIDLDQC